MSALLYLHLEEPADLGPAPPTPRHPVRPAFRDSVRHECAAAVVYALGECTIDRAACEMLSGYEHARASLLDAYRHGYVTRERTRSGLVYRPPAFGLGARS